MSRAFVRDAMMVMAAWAVAAPCLAGPPKPAPAAYATPNYALTFQVPPGLTYCPMPADWVGSDHGTTLFLTPPKACGGVGLPSGGRGFTPARTPRIEIYYGWRSEDDPARPCRRPRGTVRFFGGRATLCRVRRDGLAGVELHARYRLSSSDAEAVFTLLTMRRRLARDLERFEALAQSARACVPEGAEKGFGSGAPCPPGVRWF